MKIIRILIYEGNDEWMDYQLAKSLPDGVKDFSIGNSIKAITLGTLPDSLDLLSAATSEEVE